MGLSYYAVSKKYNIVYELGKKVDDLILGETSCYPETRNYESKILGVENEKDNPSPREGRR